VGQMKRLIFILIFGLVLIGITFFLYSELENQKKEIELKNKTIEQYKQNLTNSLQKIYELEKRIEELEKSNQEKEILIKNKTSEIEKLNSKLEENQIQIQQLKNKLENELNKFEKTKKEYEQLIEQINSTMSWFSQNAYFPEGYKWESDIFLKLVQDECIYKNKLNVPCITHFFEHSAMSLRYKTEELGGKKDYLQSIKETILRGYGDCEDYALMLKAILNTLKEKNQNLDIKLSYAAASSGSRYIIYPLKNNEDEYWYYPDSTEKEGLRLNDSYFYVVCYYDKETNFGHCANAASNNKLSSAKDVFLLENADVFEPQNGYYLGKISEEFKICSKAKRDSNFLACENKEISLVITDKDIYTINNESEWIGLEDKIKNIQKILENKN